MNIKNYELIQYVNILNQFSEKKYPQKISYAIIKNMNAFSSELKNYNDCLAKIMDSYKDHFVKDDSGEIKYLPSGLPAIDPEYTEQFTGELNDLLNESVEINKYTIDPACFDYDERNIYDPMTVKEIGVLQSILCEE